MIKRVILRHNLVQDRYTDSVTKGLASMPQSTRLLKLEPVSWKSAGGYFLAAGLAVQFESNIIDEPARSHISGTKNHQELIFAGSRLQGPCIANGEVVRFEPCIS